VVMARTGWIVIGKTFVADNAGVEPSVTVKVVLNVPAAAGVPFRTPSLERVSPPGSPDVAAQVYVVVPGEAVNVTGPYARPTAPFGSEAVVIVGGTAMLKAFVVLC